MLPVRWDERMLEEYNSRGLWTPITWSEIYDHNAFLYADNEAIVCYRAGRRESINWGQLKRSSDRLASAFLGLGLKRDDRIICQLPNCIENVIIRVACEKAGLIHCYSAMNTWERENDHFLKSLKAVGVITVLEYRGRRHYDLFRSLQNRHPYLKHIFLVGPEDKTPEEAISISKLMRTSLGSKPAPDFKESRIPSYEVSHIVTTTGTTGLPKLICVTANSTRLHGRAHIEHWKIGPSDVGLATGFLWTGPSVAVWGAIPQVGGKMILMESFDSELALRIIEKEKVTYIASLPPHIIDMVDNPNFEKYHKSSVRFITFAGAPFPPGQARRCEERFRCPIVNYYGTMDTFMFFATSFGDPFEARVGSVGRPDRWSEYKIVNPETGKEVPRGEVGVLYWRGPMGAGGYYNDPEMTKKAWGSLGIDGWYNTGDLAREDNEGRIWLMGRVGDMILRGGQNIYPKEVEDLLGLHPKIRKVCVVPMPDSRLGERACACVVAREKLSFEEILKFLEGQGLAKYKLPERLEVMSEFPMVGDKVDKRRLTSYVCNRLLAEGKISKELVERFEKEGKLCPELVQGKEN